MEGADWGKLFIEHWPTLTLLLVGLFSIYHVVRFLSLTFGWGMGAVGKYWRTRRQISDAKVVDLEKRIVYLDDRVSTLEYRDECYFAYMLIDQEWHRRHELRAKQYGWDFEHHITFLEFRDQWIREHKQDSKERSSWM